MGIKMKIEKNTICYTSEVGHNNFWYPTSNKLMIKEGSEIQTMTWIGGGTKTAVKLLKSCLVPIHVTSDTAKNTSPPNKNEYTIVWIEKNV